MLNETDSNIYLNSTIESARKLYYAIGNGFINKKKILNKSKITAFNTIFNR